MRIVNASLEDNLHKRLRSDLRHALEVRGLTSERARSFASQLLMECANHQGNEAWVTDYWFHKSANEIHAQGVTEDDLKWWLDKPELQRKVILKLVSIDLEVAFLTELARTNRWQEASKLVRGRYPIIGNPDQDLSLGASRSIPPPLIKRVESLLRSAGIVTPFGATMNSVIRDVLDLP